MERAVPAKDPIFEQTAILGALLPLQGLWIFHEVMAQASYSLGLDCCWPPRWWNKAPFHWLWRLSVLTVRTRLSDSGREGRAENRLPGSSYNKCILRRRGKGLGGTMGSLCSHPLREQRVGAVGARPPTTSGGQQVSLVLAEGPCQPEESGRGASDLPLLDNLDATVSLVQGSHKVGKRHHPTRPLPGIERRG